MSNIHGRFCEVNGGQLYYEDQGKGEVLVFIHGFTLDHRMWAAQAAFFAPDHRVITYDARGFGQSSIPDGPYDHAEDLYMLLRQLGVTQAHIVGLSMGGRIAINFTLAHPSMVQTLTVMDSALDGYPSEVDWNVHAREEGLEVGKRNWLNHEVFAGTRQCSPQLVPELARAVEDYSGWHWLNRDPQHPANSHALTRLDEIKAPTLILVGEHDLTYYHNISKTLADGITGSRKVVIMGAGHMSNMEKPDKVNKLLQTQLSALPTPDPLPA